MEANFTETKNGTRTYRFASPWFNARSNATAIVWFMPADVNALTSEGETIDLEYIAKITHFS